MAELIQMLLTNGAHLSPLELEIEKIDMAELCWVVLTIRAQWSPLELKIENRDMAELTNYGAYHWSPVEFIGVEDLQRCLSDLIQMVLIIGAHWSPLELEIEKGQMAELI